jgi:alginate O-acetyltransferase complex protein AlgI
MLFNSYEFLFAFLPAVFIGFLLTAKGGPRLAAAWLALASLFFYGWWSPKYVPLLLGSVLFNFVLGYFISQRPGSRRGKIMLFAAIATNLAVLGGYKYLGFAIATYDTLTKGAIPIPEIVLPLGISFFTFTQIAFLVDSWRGVAREYSPIHYLLFVTYFPHLIAGPVLHHRQMMPQFAEVETYRFQPTSVAAGLLLFAIGLSKKVLLADMFARGATPFFEVVRNGTIPTFIDAWSGALAYTFQLYFDFSGYSDMAIGLSLLFGVLLPLNFNSPYKAESIIEFWRRWHMTLSLFLKEYLYIPLGGNRHGEWRRYTSLLLTMILGGLWHGANWTFVAWGAFHGLLLIANHGVRRIPGIVVLARIPGFRLTAWAVTFLSVVTAWVVFRAHDLSVAVKILGSMYVPTEIGVPRGDVFVALMLGLTLVTLLPNSQEIVFSAQRLGVRRDWTRNGALAGGATAIILFACLLALGRTSEFLYFQF